MESPEPMKMSDEELSNDVLERSNTTELEELYDLFAHPGGIEPKRAKLGNSLYGALHVPTSQMSLKQAYGILLNASQGNLDLKIPVRSNASPIVPSEPCFYVDSSISDKKRRRGVCEDTDEAAISVKYQSFYNAEVYWTEESGYLEGVCARGMSKRSRGGQHSVPHGYSGRWFTLVRRTQKDADSDEPRRVRDFVVSSVSLVQFWKNPARTKRFSAKEKSIHQFETTSVSSDQASTDTLDANTRVFKGNLNLDGDLFVDGDLAMNNLHVRGSLLVEGGISGQLVTPMGAADYAEWFAYRDPGANITPGMVVQLRSPEQKITLDTNGEGPYMVVSTAPSVAAGVPYGSASTHGALCAFIGQVPVKVRGNVNVGEFIFPSGLNDGYAVSGHFLAHQNHDALGTAMTAAKGENGKESTVLCFVRWRNNLKWQLLKASFQDQLTKSRMLLKVPIGIFNLCHLVSFAFLYTRPEFVFSAISLAIRVIFLVYVMYRYPYVDFIIKNHLYAISSFDIVEGSWQIYELSRLIAFGDEDFGPYVVFLLCGILCKGTLFGMSMELKESFEATARVAANQNIQRSDLSRWIADVLKSKQKYI